MPLLRPKDVPKLLKRIRTEKGPIAVDTETTGLSTVTDRIVGLCLSVSNRHGVYAPFRHEEPTAEGGWRPHRDNLPRMVVKDLVRAIVESGRPVIMHNAPFDMAMCAKEAWEFPLVYDTMVAKWMLQRGVRTRLGLKQLAKAELGVGMLEWDFERTCFWRSDMDLCVEYAADDAKRTRQLWTRYEPELRAIDGFWYCFTELEMPVAEVVAHMKRAGFPFDSEFIRTVHDDILQPELVEIQTQLDGLVRGTFPTTSPQAIGKMMMDDLKWWVPKTERGKSGYFSTAAWVIAAQLEEARPKGKAVAKRLLRYRKLDALRSRYTLNLIDLVDEDGRIHAGFHQTGTDTGRFSSSGPNLQNIPRPDESLPPIRKAFRADPGYDLIDCDYSQVELRLMAHYSQDPVMLEVYKNGGDIHQTTADAVGSTRQDAKAINFGLIYLMSAWSLAGEINRTVAEAEKFHAAYFRRYRGVRAFHQRVERQVKRDGFVKTMAGRHRLVPDIDSSNYGKFQAALRMAVNTKIQGSAADLMKIAMRNLHRCWKAKGVLDERVEILSQVHDELIIHSESTFTEEAVVDVRREFENAVKLRVPLVADPGVGKNWLEAH